MATIRVACGGGIGHDAAADVATQQFPVGRQADDAQAVNRAQFARHLPRRAGHAAELQIAVEETLIGDARQRLARAGKLDAFLGLDQLVQALFPTAIGHGAAGIFVDDLHLAVGQDVMPVTLEQVERGQRLADELLAGMAGAEQAGKARAALGDHFAAGIGQQQRAARGVENVMIGGLHVAGDRQGPVGHFGQALVLSLGRDDQRRARLIHKNAVGLIDNRDMQPAQQQPAARIAEQRGDLVARIAARRGSGDAVLERLTRNQFGTIF